LSFVQRFYPSLNTVDVGSNLRAGKLAWYCIYYPERVNESSTFKSWIIRKRKCLIKNKIR